MPTRGTGHRPDMQIRLHVDRCRRCDRRVAYPLHDVRPGGPIFACPRCHLEVPLRLTQLVKLAQQDQARHGLLTRHYFIEGQLLEGYGRIEVPAGARLRLHLPRCPGCQRPQAYFLGDVYDAGPLFMCPVCPDHEWHVHLDDLRAFALADRLRAGGLLPTHLLSSDPLLEPVDRRRDEAVGSLREEALRRGHQPRELPWNVGRR
jgi:hypothetical protein